MEHKKGLSRSSTQLTKPSPSIFLTIPNLNKDLVRIYDSYSGEPKIRDLNDNKKIAPLIDSVGRWRFYLGLKEEPSKEEIIINVNFIREHFASLSVSDIDRAIQMSVAGKLDVDNECYGKFSPLYISKILNAYSLHRNNAIQEVKLKLQKLEQDKPKVIDKNELAKSMYALFMSMHESSLKGEQYDDFGGVWYNKIRKYKWFEISKDLAQQAYNYGMKRISFEATQGSLRRVTLGEVMSLDDKKEKAKVYARSYIVNKWLLSISDAKVYAKKMFTKETLIE
jgi:hypothetical protein